MIVVAQDSTQIRIGPEKAEVISFHYLLVQINNKYKRNTTGNSQTSSKSIANYGSAKPNKYPSKGSKCSNTTRPDILNKSRNNSDKKPKQQKLKFSG